MILERTLAEIGVLAKELNERANENLRSMSYDGALRGVTKDAELVYSKYCAAKKAIRTRRISDASVYTGELALDCKNLVDNLNVLAQLIYGTQPINLKSLTQNTQTAPLTEDGQTFHEVFTAAHDSSRQSLLKKCRDSKGHGRAHLILRDYLAPGRYTIQIDGVNGSQGMDAESFIDEHARAYLEMTQTILQTIANRDASHFKKQTGYRELKTKLQRARNFYQRHSKPIAIAVASTLLTAGAVGGSLGTIAYQNHQREEKMKAAIEKRNYIADRNTGLLSCGDYWEASAVEIMEKEIVEERRVELQKVLISHPDYSPSYNLKLIFGVESNLFHQTIINLEQRSKKLGGWIERYMIRAAITPQDLLPQSDAKKFLENRERYLQKLDNFSVKNKGKVPTTDTLKTLEKLVKEEEKLDTLESDIVSFFPRLR